MISNSNKYFLFLIITLVVTFSSIWAQDSTLDKVESGTFLLGCQKSSSVADIIYNCSVELIEFISTTVNQEGQQPKIIGGKDSLLAKIKYPELALRAGVEGIVTLEFIIDSLGIANYKDLLVINSLGAGCDEVAIGALLEQKYIPAMKKGVAINLMMRATIRFTIINARVFNSDYIPRSLYFDKEDLKSKLKPTLYPPPNIEEPDSANSTDN